MRKDWIFADSQNGAKANAILYTLVETAKANELNVYKFLSYILKEMPERTYNNQPEILEKFLPWSKEIKEE